MKLEQLAAALDWPLAEIKQAIADGAPTSRGKTDSARFIAWYVAQRQEAMREGQGLAVAATRNLQALTRLRELKTQEMEESLIPVDAVVDYLASLNDVIRKRFAQVESKVPDLSGEQRQRLRSAIEDSVAELRGDKPEDWQRRDLAESE